MEQIKAKDRSYEIKWMDNLGQANAQNKHTVFKRPREVNCSGCDSHIGHDFEDDQNI
ncbi:MAG TPA: hypothetical protein VN703_03165 [Candidatus Sulfopaludibacter sp.]|nr:hypothetical protein [Candidatus Sulfopaludibacter sp.]